MSDNIDSGRMKIEDIDRKIVELVSMRTEAAREIGRSKLERRLPLRDETVEEKVVSRFEQLCAAKGISDHTARQLASLLIRESVDAQSMLPRPSEPRDVIVIGGAGRMGSWMCRYLESRGHRVSVWDRADSIPKARDISEGIRAADFVVIATPISVTAECLRKVAEFRPPGTVFDISSIKAPLIPMLKRSVREGMRMCSVHPMFGPDTVSVFDRNVIICDCGDRTAADEASELMNWGGARIVRMPVEGHDELMAYVLGLSHALNLAFFRALVRSDRSYKSLESVSSTTFRKQIATSRDVAFENPELYYEIQHLNPHNSEALDNMIKSMEEVREAGRSKDGGLLAEIMRSGREYFGGTG